MNNWEVSFEAQVFNISSKVTSLGLPSHRAKSYQSEWQMPPIGSMWSLVWDSLTSLLFTCQALEDIWTCGVEIMEWSGISNEGDYKGLEHYPIGSEDQQNMFK